MTTNETKEEYVKFDGNDQKKFREWTIKMKAIGARKGWVKALTEDLKIDRKSGDDADKKAVVMNDLAYHHLVMSCTDKAFFYVQAAQDADENGNARQAWKELCRRYEDVSENDLITLTTEFNTCKMKNPTEDPTLWYAELEHIHQRMQKAGAQKKSDIEMIAQIMTQVPEEYKVVTQAIRIMPASERTLKTVQKIYVDLWGAS